jgi:hypothetical protein
LLGIAARGLLLLSQGMKTISYWKFVLLITLLLSPRVFSEVSVDICAHLDPNIDEQIVEHLRFYKPHIFKKDCQSNVHVRQSDHDLLSIRAESGTRLADKMVFKGTNDRDVVFMLPQLPLDDLMNGMCEEFLGCEYDYNPNSYRWGLINMVPEKKMIDGEIVEVRNFPFDVFEWSKGASTKKIFVNNIVSKSLQCRRDIAASCENQIPPMFEKLTEPNLKVAFVLDISGSIVSHSCYDMPCTEFMIRSFRSQLDHMHPTTLVNLYLYNEVKVDGPKESLGRKLFKDPVPLQTMVKKFEAMANRDYIIYPEIVQRGAQATLAVENIGTHIFYLDDMFDRELDRVYLFSDFMDYHPTYKVPEWKEVIHDDIEKRKKAPWKLVIRSFAKLDESSYRFMEEFMPDLNLGHVPAHK